MKDFPNQFLIFIKFGVTNIFLGATERIKHFILKLSIRPNDRPIQIIQCHRLFVGFYLLLKQN